MKRRNFIFLASAGAAALAIPAVVHALHNDPVNPLLYHPQSLAKIWDTDVMNTIGLNYMLKVPKENRERVLIKRLKQKSAGDREVLATSLEQQIKRDFDTANMVMIDGWILSVTEARQCALFSLTLQKT